MLSFLRRRPELQVWNLCRVYTIQAKRERQVVTEEEEKTRETSLIEEPIVYHKIL